MTLRQMPMAVLIWPLNFCRFDSGTTLAGIDLRGKIDAVQATAKFDSASIRQFVFHFEGRLVRL